MSAGDLALVVATVLCILGFTVLVVALVFVFRSLTELRGAVDQLTAETLPLLAEMRRTVEEARGDLDRFDKVLGSAEAISTSVEGASRVGASGVLDARYQDSRARVGHVPRWPGGFDVDEARLLVHGRSSHRCRRHEVGGAEAEARGRGGQAARGGSETHRQGSRCPQRGSAGDAAEGSRAAGQR